MHSKIKGNAGQFAIATCLAENGFSVFTEEGDISKIDIIAEKNNRLIRIQCKAITPTNGCIRLVLKKSGPNYSFYYSQSMFDYFGVYDLVNKQCYFVPSSILLSNSSCLTLRLDNVKNNQKEKIRYASEFLISGFLRDYTRDT